MAASVFYVEPKLLCSFLHLPPCACAIRESFWFLLVETEQLRRTSSACSLDSSGLQGKCFKYFSWG